MTIKAVIQDLEAFAVAYPIGLALLLLSPGRQAAEQPQMLIVAVGVWIVVGTSIERLAFRRWPRIGRPWRPYRHSIPSLVGLLFATALLAMIRGSVDWALLAYAVCIPLAFTGASISDLLWARERSAAESGS